MKLSLVAVGKVRDRGLALLAKDYAQRIGRFVCFETHEVRDAKGRAVPEIKRLEGERLLDKLPAGCRAVALDERGRDLTSEQLAESIEQWAREGVKDLRFVIGGPDGLSAPVLERCDESLRLSSMTLPHEVARVILLEQLYRAWTILRGLPYHKA